MSKLMQLWNDFAETLNTRGGTIALLFMSSVVLCLMLMRTLHDTGEGVAVIRTTFSAFTGALLIALTNKDKDKPNGGGGNGGTTK